MMTMTMVNRNIKNYRIKRKLQKSGIIIKNVHSHKKAFFIIFNDKKRTTAKEPTATRKLEIYGGRKENPN